MASNCDKVMGNNGSESNMDGDPWDNGSISDDDILEEREDGTWIGMGMTRGEKIVARRPWTNSLIINLIGRSIGYHFLWRRHKVMWRTQDDPFLIDLVNDFFIVKLGIAMNTPGLFVRGYG